MRTDSGYEISVEELRAEVGSGWGNIISRLVMDLYALGWDGRVGQVKEKWGGLRFYVDEETDAMIDRITEAEEESFETCEQCGTKEDVTTVGRPVWRKTLCYTCSTQ